MTDDIKAIRDALAAGPTPGPWAFSDKDRSGIATVTCCEHIVIGPDYGKPENACYDYHACGHVDAAYIAAVHPERIARLLDALQQAQAALSRITDLDPATDSEEGYNEWGEADCFKQAQKIAAAALKRGA